MTKSIRAALALAVAAALPAACGETPDEAASSPDAPEGIAVSNGRLMLPAVAGNPAAVYFDVANSGATDRVIAAASVAGAERSMMHLTEPTGMVEIYQIPVKAGETAKLEPGGTHVMVLGLPATVVAGGEVEVTVTFVGGDKASFPAEVRAAGEER